MQLEILSPHHPNWASILQSARHDIYHLPGYVSLEAQRYPGLPEGMLISEGDCSLFVPYLLRCGDDIMPGEPLVSDVFDAVSPYGYPGLILNDVAQQQPEFVRAALLQLKQGLRERGICAAFFRLHPILNADLQPGLDEVEYQWHGETVSVDLTLSEAEIWGQTKGSHRNRINRAQRQGMKADMVPCAQYLPTFLEIYTETMGRVGAAARYLEFDANYFFRMLEILGDRLHLCLVRIGDEVASAGLYTEWHGIVQAIFGGTRTAFLKPSPSTLETHFVSLWARERGNQYLHLGGGVGASQDPLFQYKAGFSKQRHSFFTMRLITDVPQYQTLVNLRAKLLGAQPEALLQSNFFPAYRASIGE